MHLVKRHSKGIVRPDTLNLTVEGNSISDASAWGSSVNWWQHLQTDWPQASIRKLALSGGTIDDMIGRIPSASAWFWPGKDNILSAWEVGNQMLISGSTARVAIDKLWEYTALATAIGYRVIVITPPKRYIGPTGYEYFAGQEEAIGYMEAEWEDNGASGYLPIHNLDVLSRTYPSGGDKAYWHDGTHPNTKGQYYIKEYIKAFIERMPRRGF